MTAQGDVTDTGAYISSSKYRLHVLEALDALDRATPKEIAERVGDRRPHVSRAISELRERDVVELQVPESRSVGRYYGLTEKGATAYEEVQNRISDVDWTVTEPADEDVRAVVRLAREEFGDWLRLVALYDGAQVRICHADPDVLASYSEDEFERGLRTVVLEHSLDSLAVSTEECWSKVLHFENFSVVKVLVEEDTQLSISFSNATDVSVPSFSESVVELFE
ncbi:hypothetical protein [Halobellus salinisoli]|uniref:hypothetical protein n=1 Tax=Halobellus salinisoli TaxID=3108500 RepID=UPI00300B8859